MDEIADYVKDCQRPFNIYLHRPAKESSGPVTISLLDDSEDNIEFLGDNFSEQQSGSLSGKLVGPGHRAQRSKETEGVHSTSSSILLESNISPNESYNLFPNGTIVQTRFGAGTVEPRRLPVRQRKRARRKDVTDLSGDTRAGSNCDVVEKDGEEAEITAIQKKQRMKSGFQAKALRQREIN